jgi:antitoxin MazE
MKITICCSERVAWVTTRFKLCGGAGFVRTITVMQCGRICIGRRKTNLSQVFAGQLVGISRRRILSMIHLYLNVYLRGGAMQVSKWGNSLAVRLPATVVDALGLKEGDQIEIQVAAKHSFAIAKAPGTRELLARLRKFRGRLPATFKFDRLEANERR